MDVDGVLRNWLQTILMQINKIYETKFFNKDITEYNFESIIKEQVPGFDRETLTGIHKRCAENGMLADASIYKDGMLLFKELYEAGFPIRLVTYQPEFAKESFYRWITENHLADKISGIDFLPPEDKPKSSAHILIDDNPQVIISAMKVSKPVILWKRNWNKSWVYPGDESPDDRYRFTALYREAFKFAEYWLEKSQNKPSFDGLFRDHRTTNNDNSQLADEHHCSLQDNE